MNSPKQTHDHASEAGVDPRAHPHEAASASPSPLTAGTIYICPMHPEIRRNEPGSCPKCGMTLEPVMPTPDVDTHAIQHTVQHDAAPAAQPDLAPPQSSETSPTPENMS